MVAPSTLSADNMHLSRDTKAVIEGGIEGFHIDVVDGRFVPNLSYESELIKDLKRSFLPTKAETHLVNSNLDITLPLFAEAGCDILEFHYEVINKPDYRLNYLKDHNVRYGTAINPPTSADKLRPFLNRLDQVLLMTAKPGFGDQKFEEVSVDRLTELRDMIKDGNLDLPIEVDGGIDRKTSKSTRDVGAKIFVAGPYIFKNGSIEDQIMKSRKEDK